MTPEDRPLSRREWDRLPGGGGPTQEEFWEANKDRFAWLTQTMDAIRRRHEREEHTMTPEDRARLRALADKANLPWRVGDEPEWVSVADNNINPVVCQYGVEPGGFVDPDDATYAVLAANAVPALLDRVEKLEALVKRLAGSFRLGDLDSDTTTAVLDILGEIGDA